MSEFVMVRSRRRKAGKMRNLAHQQRLIVDKASTDCVEIADYVKKVEECRRFLEESVFYADLRVTLEQAGFLAFPSIVSYGLGSPSSCPTARYQFALLLLLKRDYNAKQCFLYDPVFSSVDKQLVHQYEVFLIPKNEEGKREATERTLFFMPHCGKLLYDNVLRANWGNLQRVIVIGNKFSSYRERLTKRQFQREAPCIEKVESLVEEIEVKNSFKFGDVFNDLAVHWMRESVELEMPLEAQIDLDDAEIIFSK